MDGTQQHLNRGYCKYFFDCMIVNPELSTWSVRMMVWESSVACIYCYWV